MRRGGRIFIILGLVLALISGIGVFVVLASAEPQPVEVPTTKVVVAFQQVPSRSEISADQIGQVDWPQRVPTPIGAYENPADVVGKLSLVPIYAGEPVINQMVISKDDAEARHSNAALILDKGTVAIAFGVSLNSDVAEAIQPGDRVDLIATYTADVPNPAFPGQYVVTQKTLENLLILQVGPWPRDVGEQSSSGGGGGGINIVTFQVQEQDALVLKQIENTASSYAFALRAANDDEIFQTEPVTLEYINKRFKFNIPGVGQ
ncbi:MAG TPA: Flp pilus assembly protein CpaB [Anaerolineae bacterium]|nr:Flp pilus assembly protein CpaB [Anaerolineae bacterium]